MVRTKISSLFARLACAVACVVVAGTGIPEAEAQTPTPDQIEMFRNLPPDQQQAIMDTLRQGGGRDTKTPDQQGQQSPPLVMPRQVPEQKPEDVDQLTGQPKLKGNDTVLVTLGIRQFERQAPEFEQRQQQQRAPQQPQDTPGQGQQSRIPSATVEQAPPVRNTKPLDRNDEELRPLQDFRDRILRRNPYKLDKWGVLNMPELGPIALAGLTIDEANQRLAAEPRLQDFVVQLTRLPLEPIEAEALKPFGYDLFAGTPSTFAPATDVPVPAEYVVGPGDTLEVQLFGNTKGRYSLIVGRDGRIDFPETGPLAVSGRRFEQVRDDIEKRVREQMIGTQASVSIGQLRSIRVFVLGDAQVPGSYTVSGLSTITNALFVSGGIKEIGSLRNIQLKRSGRLVTTLDLYDLLLRGDTSADVRLLPGDVIFVPPIGATVGLAGEIRRPAIYELRNETTAADLLALGGGLMPSADPTLATIERINERRARITVGMNLARGGGSQRLQSGDVMRVPSIRPVLEDSVSLSGQVHRPGDYQFAPGMRIADVVHNLDELKAGADQHYALVRRELPPDRRIQVLSADLERAVSSPGSAANIELMPRDRIYVFDLESGRDRVIEPLLRELRMQSRIGEPTPEVSITGSTKVPGKYPLERGMRVSDLLRAGGRLDEAAYGGQAELTRYESADGESRRSELIQIDLRRVLAGDAQADIALQPFDYLVIKEVPQWADQEEVEVRGEVRFPGRYPIHRGETLGSLMQRAGGVTDLAFVPGAVFTREDLREREKQQLHTLADRMESDLAQLSIMSSQEAGIRDASQTLSVGQSLLANLRDAQPVGRLVIDLNRAMRAEPGSAGDIVLKAGDRLMVPGVTQEVTVIGEVQSTTSHLYRADLSRDDYIAMSGGLSPRADDDHVYVVRADGSVVMRSGAWFGGGIAMKPGDTIVAPLDTERMRPLPFWTSVTQIIYHLAISAAAVNSF